MKPLALQNMLQTSHTNLIPKCLALISEKPQNFYLGQPDLQILRYFFKFLSLLGIYEL